MKKILKVDVKEEALSLFSEVTYKNEAYWYGEAERPLKLSIIVPKHKETHKKLPLFVWLCGGAFQVVDRNVWLPEFIPIAREGFIVASVEYRTTNDVPFPAYLTDAKAAIRYLRAHAEQYCIDVKNVFIGGESAGGLLAAQVGVFADKSEYDVGDFLDQSSAVNGVIDFYGPVTDAQLEFTKKNNFMLYLAELQRIGGMPEEKADVLKASSVLHSISSKTPPFLIFHGTADEKVSIKESEELYSVLTDHHVDCDLIELEGAMHGADEFFQPEIRKYMMEFMRKNMK